MQASHPSGPRQSISSVSPDQRTGCRACHYTTRKTWLQPALRDHTSDDTLFTRLKVILGLKRHSRRWDRGADHTLATALKLEMHLSDLLSGGAIDHGGTS